MKNCRPRFCNGRRRLFFIHTTVLGAVALYFGLVRLGFVCPFLWLTGRNCPTCGCTGALLALAEGNAAAYVRLQPLALPLAVCVWLFFHVRARPMRTVCVAAFVLNFVVWLLRLI